jgi:hypothetical protein
LSETGQIALNPRKSSFLRTEMIDNQFPIGQRIHLAGHFPQPVVLESVRCVGEGFECRVRLLNGTLDEAILSRDDVEKTKRYQFAGRIASYADNLVLLTATPHHGDDDRFSHSVRLLDPGIFPEPDRIGERAAEIRRDILSLGPDCPWALRRLKEDLRNLGGRRLFPDRHAHTVTFRLNRDEYDLYKSVTAYPVYAPLQQTYRQIVVLKFVQKMRLSTELTYIFFRLSYNDYE